MAQSPVKVVRLVLMRTRPEPMIVLQHELVKHVKFWKTICSFGA